MNSLTQIERGYYPNVMRFPFHNKTKGGLGGSDCTNSNRWFVIDEVDHTDGKVTSVSLRFNCGEHFGKIRWAE